VEGVGAGLVAERLAVDDVAQAALEGAHRFAVALAGGAALGDEGLAGADAAVLDQGHGVDGFVEQPVAAAVEAVTLRLAAAGGDRGGAVGAGVGVAVAVAADVAGLAEDPGGDDDADAGELEQAAAGALEELFEALGDLLDLSSMSAIRDRRRVRRSARTPVCWLARSRAAVTFGGMRLTTGTRRCSL
jgi:hypothetical protein